MSNEVERKIQRIMDLVTKFMRELLTLTSEFEKQKENPNHDSYEVKISDKAKNRDRR